MDILKGISCVIVVLLHCPLPGLLGDGIIYGLRFSVPVFFMISGYFSYGREDSWVWSKALYILKVIILAELVYGVWSCIQHIFIEGDGLSTALQPLADKSWLVTVLCGTVFNGTLWYLYAIFWTWVILYLLRKCKWVEKSYILIPILLAVQIFGRFYVQNAMDIDKYILWFRNALTFGLPFVLLGSLMRQGEEQLLEKISTRANLGIVAAGFVLIVIEFVVSGQYMDLHVSTVVIAFGLFLLAMRWKEQEPQVKGVLSAIGGKWYLWIYLSHLFFSQLCYRLYQLLGIEKQPAVQWLRPIMVLVLSCVFAEIAIRLTYSWKIKKKPKEE